MANTLAFGPKHYVPFLKAKAGEFEGFRHLTAEVRGYLTPLFDAQPPEEGTTPEAAIRGLVENLKATLPPGYPFFLDFTLFGHRRKTSSGAPVADLAWSALPAHRLEVIPVVGTDRLVAYLRGARQLAKTNGVGLRLTLDDLAADDINAEIEKVLKHLQVGRDHAHLLIDAGVVGKGQVNLLARTIAGTMAELRGLSEFRSLTLASSAFPEDLKSVRADADEDEAIAAKTFPRRDWSLWRAVAERNLPRKPAFGDYGTEAPALGKGRQPAAGLRYTTADEWLVLKGRKDEGNEHFFDVAAELTRHPAFCGADFSYGDKYIADRAKRRGTSGGAQQWREAGANHHLTFVVRQLASFDLSTSA